MTVPLNDGDLPPGFRLAGVRCGISSVPGKKDLALFYSERPARAAGVFTRNLFAAAPVEYCRKKFRRSSSARAVIVNSGCANACTGRQGAADTAWTAKTLAGELGVSVNDVLVASTGVIGRPLPRPALARGVTDVARRLLARKGSTEDAVRAIMTTDTRPKAARGVVAMGGRSVTLWGCAKGAGMIHPNMATMLSVVLTDAPVSASQARAALSAVVGRTFNTVSVDGDTSTNDSLFLLANGAEGARVSARDLRNFQSALEEVCFSLASQIVTDGEGATRVAWISVRGARTESDARQLAATVATSPLVKTALHGADPNWGRILAALGRAGVPFQPSKVDVRLAGTLVCRRGERAAFSERAVHPLLKKDKVAIDIDLHQGRASGRYLTCDFSKEYIAVNADYTT